MSYFKITVLAAALAVTASGLSGCNSINYLWQLYDGDVDTSLREPTGYYEHAKVKNNTDQLVVPQGLAVPVKDRNMEMPDTPVLLSSAAAPVGEDIDVRAPVVQLRSQSGVQTQWAAGESIIWLNPYGRQNVADEAEAWNLLLNVLATIGVQPGEQTPGAYELTTMAADYNEFGTPVSVAGLPDDALRYRQVYRIRIGRGADGNIGIATSVIGSMTIASAGWFSLFNTSRSLSDILTPAELERFATGFNNNIIRGLDEVNAVQEALPEHVTVTMDRDNNEQDCFAVSAPYQATWNVLRRMLPDWGFEITEYSVSHSTINVDYDEPDSDEFRARGVDNFGLEDGEYIFRVSIDGQRTFITLYDEDDKPVRTEVLTRLYPGFSRALTQAFAAYAD